MVKLIKFRDRFAPKTEDQHYNEIKSLPIRMKDRRVLYGDIQAIYDFERELKGKEYRKKTIPFFRIRLLWNTFIFHWNTVTLWQNSLREIEIQRGTLTANVFYFIRATLKYNFAFSVIVIVGIVIPHTICFGINISDQQAKCSPNFNQSDPAWMKFINDTDTLIHCCFQAQQESSQVIITNHKLEWLIRFSRFIGGSSSWLTTPFFYGHYSPHLHSEYTEDLTSWFPVLYAVTVIIALVWSFVILIRHLADGIKEIVRNKDGDACAFSELIFCGYDHRTPNAVEARFKRKLWLHNLRLAIKSARAWQRHKIIDRKVIITRIIVFVAIAVVVGTTSFLVLLTTDLTNSATRNLRNSEDLWNNVAFLFASFLPSFFASVSNIVFPILFIKISRLEQYTTETTTAIIIYRSLIVRMLSIAVAMFRVFDGNFVCNDLKPNTCTICTIEKNGTEIQRHPCWEGILGREFYKLLMTELIMKISLTFLLDPVRRMLKKLFFGIHIMRRIGTLRFNVIRHSIDIINVQVLCWMGFYFAPTLPIAVCVYLFVIFYVKKFSVLVNSIGTPESHRVARTTFIFLTGKLAAFVLALIFVFVLLGELQPSRGCGPFAIYRNPWESIAEVLQLDEPDSLPHLVVENMFSLSVSVPLFFISLSTLYYFYAQKARIKETTRGLKELIYLENQDKQYLAHKLMQLRTRNMKMKNYYDPFSVFDSEQRQVASGNKRKDLVRQWTEMKAAILPFGMTKAGIKRGQLAYFMRKHSRKISAQSSSGKSSKSKSLSLKISGLKKGLPISNPVGKKGKSKNYTPSVIQYGRVSDEEGPQGNSKDSFSSQKPGSENFISPSKLPQILNKILGRPYTLNSDSTSVSDIERAEVGKTEKKKGALKTILAWKPYLKKAGQVTPQSTPKLSTDQKQQNNKMVGSNLASDNSILRSKEPNGSADGPKIKTALTGRALGKVSSLLSHLPKSKSQEQKLGAKQRKSSSQPQNPGPQQRKPTAQEVKPIPQQKILGLGQQMPATKKKSTIPNSSVQETFTTQQQSAIQKPKNTAKPSFQQQSAIQKPTNAAKPSIQQQSAIQKSTNAAKASIQQQSAIQKPWNQEKPSIPQVQKSPSAPALNSKLKIGSISLSQQKPSPLSQLPKVTKQADDSKNDSKGPLTNISGSQKK